MVCHSLFKDNLVIKQDWNGSIVRDLTTGVPVRLQKIMLMCNLRVLDNHLIEHFDDATESNCVLISETKLGNYSRRRVPTSRRCPLVKKIMCGCENCILFDDMHECLNLYQKRYIKRMKRDLKGMRDG